MAALHTSSVAILLSFFKNFFRSNLMLKQRIAIFVSSHHGRPEGVLRTVLCLHSGTVDNLKWPKILHDNRCDHNNYGLVLIRNPFIRSARTSCTIFGWFVRPFVRKKNLDHLYTGIYAL